MLTPQLRKFTDLYGKYGLGATKNLHLICQLLILGRTCSLWKLKDYVGLALDKPLVQPASHYQRLIRFFDAWQDNAGFILDVQRRTLSLLRRFRFTHLLLDGTSWKRGQQKYHYMVLSVLVGSVAIPIYWKQLGKIGASSQAERKALFTEAMKHLDLKGMTLLADREYVGQEWFKFLIDNKIEFVIRLRFGDFYQAVDEAPGKTYQQMYDQCRSHGKFCRKRIKLGGQFYFISMRPNPKGTAGDEVIIFLTRLRPVKKTVDQYIKRWRIECLFRHLKSNGFDLEAINFKPLGKSNLLMAIVGRRCINSNGEPSSFAARGSSQWPPHGSLASSRKRHCAEPIYLPLL
ncbi:transposase [Lewinella lacunae]|uniref:Transposase n=2 Tax=Neolewinella lacunae TaxID=1517758 RepID=A0A923T8D6_9BACT|nr:transposase [Neolewinella lacunae]MBC6993838.1 transposase [Neolewinella lacunae]